jgi:hypothetical protein
MNLVSHDEATLRFDGFYPINPSGLLALVLLRHPAHSQQSCRF